MKEHKFEDGIELKQCSKCKQWKSLDNFTNSKKYKDGLNCQCRQCTKQYRDQHKEQRKEYNKKYYKEHIKLIKEHVKAYSEEHSKTPESLIYHLFNNEQSNSKKRNIPYPDYTLAELKAWSFKQDKFWNLYNSWKEHNYNKWYRPSIDRINAKKGYTFSNIHLLNWKENHYKQKIDSQFKAKSVYQLKNNRVIATYPSAVFAAKKLEISYSTIYACCNGKRKTAGGFGWKYTKK